MRNTLRFLVGGLLISLGATGYAQSDAPVKFKSKVNHFEAAEPAYGHPLRTAVTCSPDSNKYVFAKGTSFSTWSTVGTTGISQYYGSATGFTIKGVNLYIALDTTAGASIPITVKVTTAAANHTPTTTVLATASSTVNNTGIANGTVDGYKKYVNFTSPITVTGNYCVVVEWTGSNTPLVFVSNNDGVQEDFAGLKVNGNWAPWYTTYGYDYDILLCPVTVMSYTDATFTVAPPCLSPGNNSVAIDITYPSIMDNKFYSTPAFNGFANESHGWNYGDGFKAKDGDHTYYYGGTGPYTITLNDTLFGWTRNCASPPVTALVATTPSATFTYVPNQGQVAFSGPAMNPAGTYAWDFGDGGSSTSQNPNHTFSAAGTYTVCLTVTNTCGSQNYCENINISSVGIADAPLEGVQVSPNPGRGDFKLTVGAAFSSVELEVFDLQGKQVEKLSLDQVPAGQTIPFSLVGHSPGIYSLKLRTTAGIWTGKVVLE